jgi:hypothetical protein
VHVCEYCWIPAHEHLLVETQAFRERVLRAHEERGRVRREDASLRHIRVLEKPSCVLPCHTSVGAPVIANSMAAASGKAYLLFSGLTLITVPRRHGR